MVYIIYGFDKMLSDVDPALIRKGRAFIEEALKKRA